MILPFPDRGFCWNDTGWIKDFKEKRLAYGVSQNKLAWLPALQGSTFNKIESGSAVPSEELKENLLQALERYKPETSLTILFDYVRIRFPTTDVRFVVETILKLKLDFMIHEGLRFLFLSRALLHGVHLRFGIPELGKGYCWN